MTNKRLLVLCAGNSARSQMGEGLFRHIGGEHWEVHSAGTQPGPVRPEAIAVMKELGIDLNWHGSKSVDEFEGQLFDYVVTVCDNARYNCPVFPCNAKRIHRRFEDPAGGGRYGRGSARGLPAHSRPDPGPHRRVLRKGSLKSTGCVGAFGR